MSPPPAPARDGRRLLFASDDQTGARRRDLFVAASDGPGFRRAVAVPGLSTDADEFDAAWLRDGDAIVFARSDDAASRPVRLYTAVCRGGRYADIAPLALAFNAADARTLAPSVDWNRPAEMLVSGAAPAPKAGRVDVYRILVPAVRGDAGCG